MELGTYVDRLRQELAVAAEAGGDEAVSLAERLVMPLESATRLALLEALAAATDEITRELAPGSVHLRLRGRDPEFVVAPSVAPSPPEPAPESVAPESWDGAASRINFRPPEQLKQRIEEAAAADGLSVNAWLVRAATAALEPTPRASRRSPRYGNSISGWVG